MNQQENTSRFLDSFNRISKYYAALECLEEDTSLSKLELMTLEALYKEKELTMSTLAGHLGISVSRATGIIDRLIGKELVDRSRNQQDRRVVSVMLTNNGNRTAVAYQKQKEMVFMNLMSILDPREQENFISILEKIANTIENGK